VGRLPCAGRPEHEAQRIGGRNVAVKSDIGKHDARAGGSFQPAGQCAARGKLFKTLKARIKSSVKLCGNGRARLNAPQPENRSPPMALAPSTRRCRLC